MKTLYISDLDGTLLTSNTTISKYSESKLNEMIDNGLLFTFATARSIMGAKRVLGNLKINLPAIFSNGVKIVDYKTGEVLQTSKFSDEEIKLVRNLSKKYDKYPVCYQTKNNVDKFYYKEYKVSNGLRYYLDSRKTDPRLNLVNNDDELFTNDIFYFNFIDEKEELEPIYNELKKHFTCIFQQELYREEYWLEVVPNNSDKGYAIKKLKELLNVDKVVYFGDSLNDINAFLASDEAYAVENAKKELKKYATGIIKDNNSDAVVDFIEGKICEEMMNSNEKF